MLKIFNILIKETPIKDEWIEKLREKGIIKNDNGCMMSVAQKESYIARSLKRSSNEVENDIQVTIKCEKKRNGDDIDLTGL